MKQEQKFETIIESYQNGNISWVKDEVKKLSKPTRKKLYEHILNTYYNAQETGTLYFFFKLI